MKTSSLFTQPYMLQDEGHRLRAFGALVSLKASTEQTNGAFNLFDVICPIDFSTPLHIHYVEDVAIYVIEGAITFFWGDEKIQACKDTYCFYPRGTPHGFRVEDGLPARILYLTIPAGIDRFVLDETNTNTHSKGTSAAKYKIEILGQLPD